jgi:SagB-type dehydrogenase family enzyme
MVDLAPPTTAGGMPLHDVLSLRRSVRSFSGKNLSNEHIGQILWAGQGRTSPEGYRTAPSAGATYPLEVHVLDKNGVFRYDASRRALERLAAEDRRARLQRAALDQSCVGCAPVSFVIAAIVSRTSWKYGERAGRYAAMEAGSVYQNMLLEAAALGLGAVVVGAFDDVRVIETAALPEDSAPLAIVSVGVPA